MNRIIAHSDRARKTIQITAFAQHSLCGLMRPRRSGFRTPSCGRCESRHRRVIAHLVAIYFAAAEVVHCRCGCMFGATAGKGGIIGGGNRQTQKRRSDSKSDRQFDGLGSPSYKPEGVTRRPAQQRDDAGRARSHHGPWYMIYSILLKWHSCQGGVGRESREYEVRTAVSGSAACRPAGEFCGVRRFRRSLDLRSRRL
jgi:hypothetical protein